MKDLTKEPIETKVKAASLASALGSFVVALIVLKVPALAGAADLIQAAVVGAVTTLSTAAAGWLAAHTPRHPNRL